MKKTQQAGRDSALQPPPPFAGLCTGLAGGRWLGLLLPRARQMGSSCCPRPKGGST